MSAVEMNQYLTFTLDQEIFALDISSVREVLELMPITRVPRSPDYLRGVINVRGHAVPVVDLRRQFNMQPGEDTVDTCIIIVEVYLDGECVVMGALTDSVREVVELPEDVIEPAPRMGTALDSDFIHGMGRQDDGFIIILDINRVFGAGALAELATMGSQAEAEATQAA